MKKCYNKLPSPSGMTLLLRRRGSAGSRHPRMDAAPPHAARGAHRAIQPLFSRPVGLEKPFTAKQRDLSFGHTPQCHWLTVRYLASRFRFISFPLSHLLSTSPFSKRLASGMTFPTRLLTVSGRSATSKMVNSHACVRVRPSARKNLSGDGNHYRAKAPSFPVFTKVKV